MAVALDDIDLKLLHQLQVDADRTNVELARLVELSPAATLHRVRRLKETGVVRLISARLDPATAGFPLTCFVAVTTIGSALRFEHEVQSLPQIISADMVAGEMDYLLQVVARDIPDLEHVLTRLATHGGQRVTTYLKLKELKPPTPLPLGVGSRGKPRASNP